MPSPLHPRFVCPAALMLVGTVWLNELWFWVVQVLTMELEKNSKSKTLALNWAYSWRTCENRISFWSSNLYSATNQVCSTSDL